MTDESQVTMLGTRGPRLWQMREGSRCWWPESKNQNGWDRKWITVGQQMDRKRMGNIAFYHRFTIPLETLCHPFAICLLSVCYPSAIPSFRYPFTIPSSFSPLQVSQGFWMAISILLDNFAVLLGNLKFQTIIWLWKSLKPEKRW